MDKVAVVITSIFSPNQAMHDLAAGASLNQWDMIVIGDSKSPREFHLPGADFFDLESQKIMPYALAPLCPVGHYARKNLGYLTAMARDCNTIVETDDDNIPTDEFWSTRKEAGAHDHVSGKGWLNVYSLFSDTGIWPRGLPLEKLMTQNEIKIEERVSQLPSPIQQGLADGDPDVDAVFRMTQKLPVTFHQRARPVRLEKGLWSPFNSQNTIWMREAFPLLYLPAYCTFRMTDIWRSFVAQRIAWECSWELSFHNATVYQERNEHNLLRDFEHEIPGYLQNDKMRRLLEDLPLKSGIDFIFDNLHTCYVALTDEGIITDRRELDLLEAWISDVKNYCKDS